MKQYVENLVDEGKTAEGDMPCPSGLCEGQKVITPHLVQELLDGRHLERFHRFALDSLEHQEQDEHEIYKTCPRCEFPAYIPKGLKEVYCGRPGCKFRYCPQCLEEYHPKTSCEKEKKKRAREEAAALRGQLQFRPCPVCAMKIQRDGGCKYMRCPSKQCKGKTYFCYSCMALLKTKHQIHKCTDPSEPISNRCQVF